MLRQNFIALIVVAAAALSSNGQAETVRVPPRGEPALTVDLPAGWSTAVDEYGNMDISHPSRHVQVRLSVIEDERIQQTTLAEMASNMLKSAHFPPYSRTESATMAGHPAQAFFGSATNSRGTNLTYKIVWMKLDATHAAVMARMAAAGASAEETGALDALISKVRVVGAR